MTIIYLDHNVIDEFDKGKTAYLEPLFANKECLLVISFASVDEIFRGGNDSRSRKNIETLKTLGVRYIHSGKVESEMAIDVLEYDNIHQAWYQKWVVMQSNIGSLNDSHFRFIHALYSENALETINSMEQAANDQISWMRRSYNNSPKQQAAMDKVLNDPEEYKERCRQLISLKSLLPFKSIEINNIPESSVFWTCVNQLKNSTDDNLKHLGNFIEDEIENASTIEDQFTFVFFWLNYFGYWPDDLRKIDKVRSNFSDTNHATYGIACDAILTLDGRFVKRLKAALGALELKTEVGTDANELMRRISGKGHKKDK